MQRLKSPRGTVVRLTAGELAVLRLICRGKSNQSIGDELGLTRGTVNQRVSGMIGDVRSFLEMERGPGDPRVEMDSREELLIFGLQHPEALTRGSAYLSLHPDGCECASIYCAAMRAGDPDAVNHSPAA